MGAYAYHIILSTKNRARRLQDHALVQSCAGQLDQSAAHYGFSVVAYCFMPDHLHVLVSGTDGADLRQFVQHFKQATGYRYPGLWQRSYYDRILRYEEALEDVSFYIWENPVRAAFVESLAAYPFSGPREAIDALLSGEVEDRAKALSLQVPITT